MTGSSPPHWPTASVLRHDCSDGSSHYDWLLACRAPRDPDDRCALAWRVHERPDTMAPGTRQSGELLPPHRAFYLDLRTPLDLTGGRGRVHPLAWGVADLGPASGGTSDLTHAPPVMHSPLLACVRWQGGAVRHYRISDGPSGTCVQCVTPQIPP